MGERVEGEWDCKKEQMVFTLTLLSDFCNVTHRGATQYFRFGQVGELREKGIARKDIST